MCELSRLLFAGSGRCRSLVGKDCIVTDLARISTLQGTVEGNDIAYTDRLVWVQKEARTGNLRPLLAQCGESFGDTLCQGLRR
jgi:hypothetical protein